MMNSSNRKDEQPALEKGVRAYGLYLQGCGR
jgi:hypothetical protein